MKQQVPSSTGHGGSTHSKSQAGVQTRASRTPPPKVKQAPSTLGTGAKARPRSAATTTTITTTPVPLPVRRVMTSTNNRGKKTETVEEEVVRLRGEVDALQKEVQRLLRLNADLEHQQQASHVHNAATNRPQPPSKILGGVVLVAGPPPPPPPPPHQKLSAPSTSPVSKATALVDMYNSLQTQTSNKPPKHTDRSKSHYGHHSSIVDELQNRSGHLQAIKADVETKAEFINHLINNIHTSTYDDVEQVLTFVDWLDQQLSTLSDEIAVLKHFNWPERKADALREVASEHRHLKCLLTQISSLRDDGGIATPCPCEATLRKISSLLDKLEKSMSRVVNLRRSAMPSYKELRIPTDWMLDSGISSKMRLASVSLAKMYMETVLKELDCRDTAGNEAALVAQSVRFTYRVHQFAGGLDSEAMHAFEELRRRVQPVSP